ncbi:MAG: PilN domain-containing protein [Acidimicrobiia bacterium]|nr:PilN domain-containing protein [Acidimicrobiia bacterium]
MLRTNLSTRPFYNVRAVRMAIGVIAAIVVVFTLVSAVQIVRLAMAQRTLGSNAASAEDEAERLRAEAGQIRSRINPQELTVVAEAAREANAIIDRRAFSWTELFSKFEATLPPDVRITAVRPNLGDDGFTLSIGVEARRAEDLDAFMEALEGQAGFRDVLNVAEQADDDGTLQAVIEGVYTPPPRDAAPASAGASR